MRTYCVKTYIILVQKIVKPILERKSVMKIAVIPNAAADENFKNTSLICEKLSGFAKIYVSEKYKDFLKGAEFAPENDMFSLCDIVITLGGDGTLLSAAVKAAEYGKPILGVNMGRLGFLTGCEKDDFFKSGYKALESGEYKTEKRMMIEADIKHLDGTHDSFTALNDITVTRTRFARLGNIEIHIGDEFLGNYFADGVIVSTPTGSTGYSLSAGGPIIDPDLCAMLITPICPHMLHARPIAVPPDKTISLTKTYDDNNDNAVTADGKNGCALCCGETVTIKKSEHMTMLIKLGNGGFYELLRKKLQ